MKKTCIWGTICSISLLLSCQSPDLYHDAVAVWNLSDHEIKSPGKHPLQVKGDVKFVSLDGEEKSASSKRGGDGKALLLNGGWLDAGQGCDDALNISGKYMSMLARVKPGSVNGYSPVLTKAGRDRDIAYSIAFNRDGEDVYVETMIGSDDIAGAHKLRHRLQPEELNAWLDVIFRFNGKTSELFVNGILRDDEVTEGDIRDWNRRPVLIGAQYQQPYGYADEKGDVMEAVFHGSIDQIALWNKCLSDEEVAGLSGVKSVTDGKPVYYNEKYRPQFHFSAQKHWLNDPNGLVYYDGVYHLFFQYMPPHRPGAYKDWGHAISTDLVHWEQIPHHIAPHRVWSGCWSGSAVVDHHNVAGFQTGEEKAIIAFLTSGGHPEVGLGTLCTQTIAYSNDGGMTFTYYDQNPVINHIAAANRDPKVVWDADSNQWIMSLYIDRGNEFGIFGSTNLKDWTYLSSIDIKGVDECPGFEPLPVDGDPSNKKWWFLGANGDYMIGSFNGKEFKPESGVLRGDYGTNFYAAQTWSDVPDGRCLHIAWMPTQPYPGMPFEQQMNFPTEVTLRTTPSGVKAFRMPVREISKLYDKEYSWSDMQVPAGTHVMSEFQGDLYDIDLEMDMPVATNFKIGIRNVTITYDATSGKIMCGGDVVKHGIVPDHRISRNPAEITSVNNMGQAPLKPVDGKLSLRILVDRNTVEIFANDGEVVITSCFMPEDSNYTYSIYTDKGIKVNKAKIYSLKSAWI